MNSTAAVSKALCAPRAALRRVDEGSHDLRIDQLQADAHHQQDRQQQDGRPLRPQVVAEETAVVAETNRHAVPLLQLWMTRTKRDRP